MAIATPAPTHYEDNEDAGPMLWPLVGRTIARISGPDRGRDDMAITFTDGSVWEVGATPTHDGTALLFHGVSLSPRD